jgi:glycosyltransferase involved in cell wall biosynthesis
MTAKFSILIPVHNVAGYLPICLDSILSQSFRNIEIVLVDDKSTDESGAICDQYAKENESVKVIHSEHNEGVSAARNRALEVATGDYILFVDGDDRLIEGSLERLGEVVGRLSPVDVVICRYNSASGVLSNAMMFLPGATGRLEAEIVLRHLTKIDFYIDHCWPYAIARNLISRSHVRFINSKIAEDAEYIVRLLVSASTIAYCEGDFYLYNERDGSLKTTRGVRETVSFLYVADAMRQLMESDNRSAAQRAFLDLQRSHTLGAFSARLMLLDEKQISEFPAYLSPEKLPPTIASLSRNDTSAALCTYRMTVRDATLSLGRGMGSRTIYIYCTGPSAEAVMRTLQDARFTVRCVIDDNKDLSGRKLFGVPVVSAEHLSALSPEELDELLIIICTLRNAAADKIRRFLTGLGIRSEQIVHRMF